MDRKMIIAGFRSDIETVISQLCSENASIFFVDENSGEDHCPKKISLIVYLFSNDTGYSSLLHGSFGYLHHNFDFTEAFLVALEPNAFKFVFNFLQGTPVLKLDELIELINERK